MYLALLVLTTVIGFCYLFSKIVLMPFIIRSKYRKYPNVKMSERVNFLKGDLCENEHNIAQGIFQYWHYAELAISKNKPDIYLKFIGPTPLFLIFSSKALEQMKNMQPTKIDRDNIFINKFLGKMFYNSLGQAPSNANWKHRRDSSMRAMGINFASGYIKTLVNCMEKAVSKWKVGDKINFTKEFSTIEFLFTAQVLFGKDFDMSNKTFAYENEHGEIEKVDMATAVYKIAFDTFTGYRSTMGTILPFLNDYNLIQPFRRIMKNVGELQKGLKNFFKITTDENSLYYKLKDNECFSEIQLIDDLILLLFAGSDTTSHTTVSLLYFIKKYPKVFEKCKKCYEEEGLITEEGVVKEKLTIDFFDQCEYPDYVIKETMRIDHVAPETVAYKTLEGKIVRI